MARVFVLWDDSHLWGVLVLRALRALGTSHQILRATDIAEGALSGKHGVPPGVLVVPGGWARGRALRLGEAGMQAIRDFVAAGGGYLGFCGGAGLDGDGAAGQQTGDFLDFFGTFQRFEVGDGVIIFGFFTDAYVICGTGCHLRMVGDGQHLMFLSQNGHTLAHRTGGGAG